MEALADLLCLDLVVDARRTDPGVRRTDPDTTGLAWEIFLCLPGALVTPQADGAASLLATATAGFDASHLVDLGADAAPAAGALDGRMILHAPTNHPVDQYLAETNRGRPGTHILIHGRPLRSP